MISPHLRLSGQHARDGRLTYYGPVASVPPHQGWMVRSNMHGRWIPREDAFSATAVVEALPPIDHHPEAACRIRDEYVHAVSDPDPSERMRRVLDLTTKITDPDFRPLCR